MGLWEIEKNVDYHNRRQREKAAVKSLLYAMTHDESLEISHNSDGKPFVDGWNISISHTRGYAAIMLSKTKRVGLDIEYTDERVSRVVGRFLREDEPAENVESQLIHWSAKETVYKLFSSEKLLSSQIRLRSFTPQSKGKLIVENLKSNHTVEVEYRINNAFVLTYAAI